MINKFIIIGSGLIASGFKSLNIQHEKVCIYAAGVSNSLCFDKREFDREKQRLTENLERHRNAECFIYFSTCSVADAELNQTDYVIHKLAMENLVRSHPRQLILRLPLVAGVTANPHTLLNFLYARIVRGEPFPLWENAYRNIIDIDDVVKIVGLLINDISLRNMTINLACPISYSVVEIVKLMESAVGKPAIYTLTERGIKCEIDIGLICSFIKGYNNHFNDGYITKVIGKYYAKLN